MDRRRGGLIRLEVEREKAIAQFALSFFQAMPHRNKLLLRLPRPSISTFECC